MQKARRSGVLLSRNPSSFIADCIRQTWHVEIHNHMFGSTASAGRYDELIIFGCLLGFYVGYWDWEEMRVAVEIKRYANYGIVRFLSKTAPLSPLANTVVYE